MCFFVQLKNRKPLIAETDIICYKSGFITNKTAKVLISELQHHIYRIGHKQPKVTLKKKLAFNEQGVFDIAIVINEGYHSYSTLSSWPNPSGNITSERTIKEGLPMFLKATCIIPKGTLYYYNDKYKQYVSETIMLKKL